MSEHDPNNKSAVPVSATEEIRAPLEPGTSPSFEPFVAAMDNVELPLDIREMLAPNAGRPFSRSYLHGRIHSLADEGAIPLIVETVLLSGLQASTDQDDLRIMALLGESRKPRLVESNMEPWDCKTVCWGDMTAEERSAYMDRMLKEDAGARRANLKNEKTLGKLMAHNMGVKEAAKKHGRDPMLLASLAREIDNAQPGWRGLRELLELFPPVEGFGDPWQELRNYIDAYDRGEVADDVGPHEWIEGKGSDDDQKYYFYLGPLR